MIRSWGVVALTGSAQPWFGDVLTAAVALPRGDGIIPVTLAATRRYKVGDRIVLDPLQTNQDTLLIESIFSATVLYCASEGNAPTHVHSNGVILQLSIPAMDVSLQAVDGNAATVWLGSDDTVTAIGGGSAFYQLQKVTAGQPPAGYREAGSIGGSNNVRTSDGWMIGTAADKVAVGAYVL